MKMCSNCGSSMVGVISFSKEKNEKFDKCRNCHSETIHRKLNEKELSFREVLGKEIHKRR